ncbi:uncharacterized protein LOC118750003 [Rhagoletis pomonella]|uniref:uncharacterized protein LOC118750003 n=1 Tax=Rhagoletis pomonella TaxID=28610 RepID=UPI0017832051|nr:uncharacterized protein LOC118750003 [Rhagoletis pomonella]
MKYDFTKPSTSDLPSAIDIAGAHVVTGNMQSPGTKAKSEYSNFIRYVEKYNSNSVVADAPEICPEINFGPSVKNKRSHSNDYSPHSVQKIFRSSLPVGERTPENSSRLFAPPMRTKSGNIDYENFCDDNFFPLYSFEVKPTSATPYATHHIDTGGHPPIALPPYRLLPQRKDLLKLELDKMLNTGVIVECESPWAAPVVIVPKKSGGIRICVDYRELNAITKPDRYPLPRIDDLLHEAKDTNFMSTLDLQSGYWQVGMKDEDQDKTAFVTPFGMYIFTRMPFGLRNAPATFQRLIDRLKVSLGKIVLVAYLDDIILCSKNFKEHLEELSRLFERLQKFGLKVNKEKCRFACHEVKYLGHILTPDGIKVDPSKVTAITMRKSPRNVKELLSFLQACSWYRRFVPLFADVAKPLSQLTKKNAKWTWTDQQQTAFDKMKRLLTTSPILKQADENLPFILKTDASGYALGAVLIQGEGPDEHPIEYARAKDIREGQLSDPDLQTIIDCFENRSDDAAHWSKRGYTLNDGVLYCYNDEDSEDAQLVVPKSERPAILDHYHNKDTAGHYGIDRTSYKITSRYYWPGIRKDIEKHVHNCTDCQRYKATNLKPMGLYQTISSKQRFEIIAIDLFGPLPPDANGMQWIYIVEDVASRWVELFALMEATAENCGKTLIDEVFLRYGVPRRIISDNGVQFVSAVMQKVVFCLEISQVFTPVYHPQANPVERKNRDMKAQLAILVGKQHRTWAEKLPAIRFAMNTTRCQSTGYSAAFLTFGREPRTIDDVQHDLRSIIQSENFVAEITPYLATLTEVFQAARECERKQQDANKRASNLRRRDQEDLEIGSKVLVTTHVLSNATKGVTSKFAPRRDGPYVIIGKQGSTSYVIAHEDNLQHPLGTYHASSLVPYRSSSDEYEGPINMIRRRGRPRKTT